MCKKHPFLHIFFLFFTKLIKKGDFLTKLHSDNECVINCGGGWWRWKTNFYYYIIVRYNIGVTRRSVLC